MLDHLPFGFLMNVCFCSLLCFDLRCFLFCQSELEIKNQELNHLGFVRVAAIHVLVCVSSLYEYAKQNSGPLRSTVGTVEGVVTNVVGPVYEKFKGVPHHLLVFLDKKVT